MPPRREVSEIDESLGTWDKGKWKRDDRERPFKRQKFLSQAEHMERLPLPVASVFGTTLDSRNTIRKVPRRTPSVWIEGGDVFVGFNTPEVKIPPRTSNPRSPGQLSSIQWELLRFPYLPFVPVDFKFNGRLLRRLNIEEDTVPLCFDSFTVVVKPAFVDSWVRLENNLLRIVDILKASTGYMGVSFPSLPKSARLYKKYVFTEEAVARRDTVATRNRFIPLVSLVAFYCSLRMNTQQYKLSSYSPDKTARWIQYDADCIAGGVHPQWIILLHDSPAFADSRWRRRGVIIDYRASEFTALTPFFIDCGVPVVLRIDQRTMHKDVDPCLHKRFFTAFLTLKVRIQNEEDLNTALRSYIPPEYILNSIRNRRAAGVVSDQVNIIIEENTQNTVVWNETSVPNADDEKPIQTRQEFFAKREHERSEYMKTESAVQKQRRESREASARNFQAPGERSKVKVYVWNWNGTHEVRELADRGDYEMLWADAKRLEKRFDGIRNEWDLWYKDLPKKGFRPPMDDDEDDEDWAAVPPPETQVPESLAPQDFDNNSFRDEALDIFGFNLTRSDGHFVDAVKFRDLYPLIRRLTTFYGLSGKGNDDSLQIPPRLHKERLRHILQDSITDFQSLQIEERVRQLVAYLINCKTRSSPIHDLHGAEYKSFGNPSVSVQLSSFKAKEFEDAKSPYYSLYSVELLDSNGAIRHDRGRRRFFVWNALTALAIKRFSSEETTNFDSIAHILLDIGVPFILALPRRSFATPAVDDRIHGLGTWTKESKRNDALDFLAYMRKCRELLSVRRLRKCLRFGGIIWRLACLFLDNSDGLDAPTPDALNEPQTLIGPDDLVDDGVSKEEIELLIGTFYIVPENGTKDAPVQYSYWPPPYIWVSHGDCVGPWSPDNEDWFLNRVRLYLEGGTSLFSIGEWRHKVSGFRESKDMMKNLEALSRKFLS